MVPWGLFSSKQPDKNGEDLQYGSMNSQHGAKMARTSNADVLESQQPQPPALDPDQVRVRKKLERIKYWMDDCMRIPCTNRRIGLDPIIGVMPFVGDFGSAAISLAFVARAAPVLSKYTITRMLVNVWIDAVTGVVPFAGDIFDIGWKANERNLEIFDDQMHRGSQARCDTDRRWLITIVIIFLAFCFVTTLMVIGVCVLLILWITGNL